MKTLLVNALQITYKDDGMGKYALTIVEFLEANYSDKVNIKYLTTKEGSERLKNIISKDQILNFNYDKSDNFIKKLYMENYKIPYLLKKFKADFYWSLDGKLPLLDYGAHQRILTIHDVGYIDVPEHYSLIQRLYWSLVYKHRSKNADIIIAISEFTKSSIIKNLGVEKEKIKVIYNFTRQSFEANKNVSTYNGEIENYFLYYGQVSPRKNIVGLIEAYYKYYRNSTNPDKLIIIGKKYNYPKLESLEKLESIRSLIGKYIIFKGYVDDKELSNYISRAKFIINPSYYEGFGLPVIESFEMNKLILASNNTSMVEFINESENYTFNPFDIDSIKNMINYFSNLSEKELMDEYQIESSIYKNKINRKYIVNAYKSELNNIFLKS
ncbi:glycosyltransferase family 4 protein [Bacillus marinisedimentorum]|uniref:glycosyltransferase family 4 protein n=1 Tax=Bacillus marinisedimentorum TaxID=1821260 RepID=UPI0007E18D8F|nr:glycosyltransferase family 1 protein [Bacillus marinisedimentorum]